MAIDEAHGVTSTMAGDAACRRDLATIASEGAGLEFYALVSTQYGALDESVGTEQTRSNLRSRMCFQVENPSHGTFALGDDAQRWADPTTLDEKGTFYYRSNSKTTPEQIRGPHMAHKLAQAIAGRNAKRTGLHARPLVLYCGAQPCELMPGWTWQQVYDSRWERLPSPFWRDAPQTAGPLPAGVQPTANKITNRGPVDDEVAATVAAINEEAAEIPVTDAGIARAMELRAERGARPISFQGEFDQRRHTFAVLVQAAGPEGIRPRSPKRAADWAAPGSTGSSTPWWRRVRWGRPPTPGTRRWVTCGRRWR